jgi:transglutaminase-like putative cysteine protease
LCSTKVRRAAANAGLHFKRKIQEKATMKKLFQALVALFVLLSLGYAHAEDTPLRFEDYRVRYELRPDATYVVHYSWRKKVLNQRGLDMSRQTSVGHSTSVEKATITSAYTEKPDGRKIDVQPGNYQLEAHSGVGGKPAFSDRSRITVIFPDLAIGDTTNFAYSIDLKEAIFPGHFSVAQTFGRETEYDRLSVQIDAPAGLWSAYAARDMQQQVTEANGRRTVGWTFSNPKSVETERRDYSAYDPEQEIGYAFSTFKNYQQIASAYGDRAAPKAVPTERVRQLAADLTKGAADERQKVQILYEWVARNIEYAGNCVGVGVVVPRDQEFVIDNKMGDCKDHATLLQALLAAQGIKSTQVLINAGSVFRLPKLPVSSTVNHVLTYVPSLNLYLDSTSSSTPFGMLPHGVAGKPVLHVDHFSAESKTPVSPPGSNSQRLKMVVALDAEGSAKGSMSVALRGEWAADARQRFRDWPEAEQKKFVKETLRAQQLTGDGTIRFDDPKPLLAQFTYAIDFQAKNLLHRGGGVLPVSPWFFNPAPVMRFLSSGMDADEPYESECTNGMSTEEYEFTLPANLKITSLPKNTSFKDELLAYGSSYVRSANKLAVTFQVSDSTPAGLCSAQVRNAYNKSAAKGLNTLRSHITYTY